MTAHPTGPGALPRASGAAPSFERLTLVSIAEGLYALPSRAVRATMATQSDLRGQVPFEGELFTLLDPRLLFELPARPRECRAVLMGSGGKGVALLVDTVDGELEVDRRRIQELPWHFGGREQLWFSGVVPLPDGRVLAVLRPGGLLASYRALENRPRESQPQESQPPERRHAGAVGQPGFRRGT